MDARYVFRGFLKDGLVFYEYVMQSPRIGDIEYWILRTQLKDEKNNGLRIYQEQLVRTHRSPLSLTMEPCWRASCLCQFAAPRAKNCPMLPTSLSLSH